MEKKKPFYKKIFLIVLSAALLVGLIKFEVLFNGNSESTNSLKVVDLSMYRHESNILHIDGKIRNTTSKNLNGIKIEISLYNSDGVVVGSTSDYLRNLAPNETWEFESHKLIEENVSRIEVSKITVF